MSTLFKRLSFWVGIKHFLYYKLWILQEFIDVLCYYVLFWDNFVEL